MKLYVILDRSTKTEYGITDKLWLARLFYIQRYKYDNNLILIHRKSNLAKRSLPYNDLYIRYFSGFALVEEEIKYIDYCMTDFGIDYLRRKYKKKRHMKVIDEMETDLIEQCISDCILRRKFVKDKIYQVEDWLNTLGG